MTENEKDPMDQVPAPIFKVILSFLGCLGIFLVYFWVWSIVLK
jgi:hypothetical protein